MKRALLAAIAAIATLATGIGIFQVQNHDIGYTDAQNAPAIASAPPGKPIPETASVDQEPIGVRPLLVPIAA